MHNSIVRGIIVAIGLNGMVFRTICCCSSLSLFSSSASCITLRTQPSYHRTSLLGLLQQYHHISPSIRHPSARRIVDTAFIRLRYQKQQYSFSSLASTKAIILNTDTDRTKSSAAAMSPAISSSSVSDKENAIEKDTQIAFSHIHLYVDHIQDIGVYYKLETQLNEYLQQSKTSNSNYYYYSIESKQKLWKSIVSNTEHDKDGIPYVSQNRDIIQQLMVGFGFRITGYLFDDTNNNLQTRTALVTSRDPNGVQYVITSRSPSVSTTADETSTSAKGNLQNILHSSNIQRFYNAHAGRPGIGVLGFWVTNIDGIYERYQKLHPNLIANYYNSASPDGPKVLEVYAFYNNTQQQPDSVSSQERLPDTGTILRFMEPAKSNDSSSKTTIHDILGLHHVAATFVDETSQAAYCDHWVSNVFDRTEFLDTLHDTLGFTPKVDFNAGVVAAGEAQIESTVTGNTAGTIITNIEQALQDQNQVYLPINNALSEVGHVHGFLKELGQGIQHIASRVSNLVSFVQRCNDYRLITNEGFSFLRIPRSYYGVLTTQQLINGINEKDDGVSIECASDILSALRKSNSLSKENAVDLDLTRDDLHSILIQNLDNKSEYETKRDDVLDVILRSRYCNLYSLLKDSINDEQYIGIVKNQILVDIQGNDLLYQIFTSNILQRNPGDEAPFLEFIQRVCSTKNNSNGIIKPGCGGFGIRNFLTLFLSIEVSKAMQEVTDAVEEGDVARQQYAQAMVDCFTKQLNESNPILTLISDAMTDEGEYRDRMLTSLAENNPDDAAIWEKKMQAAAEKKQLGNVQLMECSSRYKNEMKAIRERRQQELAGVV